MENDKKFVIPEAMVIEFVTDDIITTSGWQEIKSNTIVNQLKKNTANGGMNLVILCLILII